MTRWSRLVAFVRRLRGRGKWEQSLEAELRSYLEFEIESRTRRGMSEAAARRTALADLGGVEPVKERVRAASTGAWLEATWRDVRYGCRATARERGFTSWVVSSLTIGIAVTVGALGFLNALLLRPFPGVTGQDRLVRLAISRDCHEPDCWPRLSSPADYALLRESLTGLQGLAAHGRRDLRAGLSQARPLRSGLVSANFFDVLGAWPALGRAFTAEDERVRAGVVVISDALWRREFESDPHVIGRSIRVEDDRVEIVGVAPAYFTGVDFRVRGGAPDLWVPLWLAERASAAASPAQSGGLILSFVGRLRDGVEVRQARAEASALASRLAPGAMARPESADVRQVRIVEPEQWGTSIILIMSIPVLVLVIACVNAANLVLARGSQRTREIAIRLAIGAGRGRIVRQMLIECALLAAIASAAALPIAWWGLRVISTPLDAPIPLDLPVVGFTLLTAGVTTIGFGLLPAIRVTAQPPSDVLGPGGSRGEGGAGKSRMRQGLVVVQVALSLALLATAWQLVATMRGRAPSSGTPGDRLLIAHVGLESLSLQPGEAEAFYEQLRQEVKRTPGVQAAGLARFTAVWTFGRGNEPGSVTVWHPGDRPERGRVIVGGYAGGDLFDAIGLRLTAGRSFTEGDRRGLPQVAIVNQAFVQSMTGPAPGQIVRVAARRQGFESSIEVRIVGVIESAMEPRFTADGAPAPKLYLPSALEREAALALYVRTQGRALDVAPLVRDAVTRIDSRITFLELSSLAALSERAFAPQLWLARAGAVLGLIALLLATSGVYAMSSRAVAARSREIAIRMAVGARPAAILTMVFGDSSRLALAGFVIGGTLALIASFVVRAEMPGTSAVDPVAFGGSAALFAATMLVASALPARRAARVDPVANLKDV